MDDRIDIINDIVDRAHIIRTPVCSETDNIRRTVWDFPVLDHQLRIESNYGGNIWTTQGSGTGKEFIRINWNDITINATMAIEIVNWNGTILKDQCVIDVFIAPDVSLLRLRMALAMMDAE